MGELQAPHFNDESEQAQCWFDHRNEAKKRAQTVTVDADYSALAPALSAMRGETCEAVVRQVVHEALQLGKSA